VSDIKVTDRRMFTPDGRLREEFEREIAAARELRESAGPSAEASPEPEPEVLAAAAAPPEPPAVSPLDPRAAAPPDAAALPASAPEKPPVGLLELVEFLASWALVGLGEMPLPDGRLARDLDAARFYIDLIGALHQKWGAGLGMEEKRFFEGYLDQLRLRYVAHRR